MQSKAIELNVWVLPQTDLTEEELSVRIMNGININGEEHSIGISPVWQTVMAFAKWVTGTISPIYINNGNGAWEVLKPSPTPQPKEYISDEQLYELFIQSQQSPL